MANGIAAKLDAAIRSVCPIFGVSIGSEADRSTWAIFFAAEATAQQMAAAATALAAFDPAVKTAAELRADQDASELAATKIDSAILALVNSTPAQLMTFAQNNFPSLTVAERNRIGLILNILAVAVRPQVRS